MSNTAARPMHAILFLLVVLAITAAVYSPGLYGPFVFDDASYITNNPEVRMTELTRQSVVDAVFADGAAFPRRGLARLTFALDHYRAGGTYFSAYYKTTNLVIHLMVGLAVFAFIWSLGKACSMPPDGNRTSGPEPGLGAGVVPVHWFAGLVTAIWLLHPLQLTAVLYASQRMTSMSAFFVLAALTGFIWGRIAYQRGRNSGLLVMLLSLGIGGGLAMLCKQNAVLLPFFAFLVDRFCFDRSALAPRQRRWLLGFYLLTVGLPLLLGTIYIALKWDWVLSTYSIREFDMYERVLTQARVLFLYVGMLLYPVVNQMTLFHDGFPISRGLLDPPETLLAVLAVVGIATTAVFALRKRQLWAFGVLWFLIGHAMESSFIGLEMIFEHRNYLPVLGLVAVLVHYSLALLPRLTGSRVVTVGTLAAFTLILGFATFTRAGVWSSVPMLVHFARETQPHSPRWAAQLAVMNSHFGVSPANHLADWQRVTRLDPYEAAGPMQIAVFLSSFQVEQRKRLLLESAGDPAPISMPAPGELDVDWSTREPDLEDPRVVAKMLQSADAEVVRRLTEMPVRPTSIARLMTIITCVREGHPACLPIADEVKTWANLAASNPRARRKEQSILLFALGSLQVAEGRLEDAERSFATAERKRPEGMGPVLGLAETYLRQGDFEAAERTLERVRELSGPAGRMQAQVESLESRLAASRRAN